LEQKLSPPKREKRFRFAATEATVLFVCCVFLAVAYNLLSDKGLPWIATERVIPYAADSLLMEDLTLPEVSINSQAQPLGPKRVTLTQAHQLYTNRKAIFLDAREQDRFMSGHIAGAIHLPYYERERWEPLLRTISKNSTIVAYCDEDCDTASRLGEALTQLGFTKVLVMEDGYGTWENSGYPVAMGEQ
jgi:3-mercaptopyruvate sulfurtransferase SseA